MRPASIKSATKYDSYHAVVDCRRGSISAHFDNRCFTLRRVPQARLPLSLVIVSWKWTYLAVRGARRDATRPLRCISRGVLVIMEALTTKGRSAVPRSRAIQLLAHTPSS